MGTIRTARKDKYSPFGGELIAKKGEKYLDKGFGQIERIAEQKMANWRCENCGDETIETADTEGDAWGKKMPSGGWACRKCGIKGRREFKSWCKVR